MVDVSPAGVPLSLNPQVQQHTGFINLARGNKYITALGWRPAALAADAAAADVRTAKPELTPDLAAIIASLQDVPMEVKAGKRITVKIDCSLTTKRYWTMMTATPALHELFVISGPTHLPPGYTGTPELTLVAKRDVKSTDVPLAAVYLMLLS